MCPVKSIPEQLTLNQVTCPMELLNPAPLTAEQWTALRAYRLSRVQAELASRNWPAIVLFDPHNVRYATGSRNMAVWTLHNHVRYTFVPAHGLPVLFEFGAGKWDVESAVLESVGEIRRPRSWTHFYAGSDKTNRASAWADELAELVEEHCGGDQRLAFDHLDSTGLVELNKRHIQVLDGEPLMEHARLIKSNEEIVCLKHAIAVAQIGMQNMRDALQPGMTENQLWSWLHQANIAHNGEWIETRLLSSGPRTNPWMQESSDRIIQADELVAFDTDMIGPNGYCADISRTYLCGDQRADDEQRHLYQTAYEQIQHNISILRAGRTLHDVVSSEWRFPDEFLAYRYGLAHGVGLKDEFPFLVNAPDIDALGDPQMTLEAGMVLSVESYIGAVNGRQGVKLEEQVLITDTGCDVLSDFEFDAALMK
jgi:Xaa-Pro dipeptidase